MKHKKPQGNTKSRNETEKAAMRQPLLGFLFSFLKSRDN